MWVFIRNWSIFFILYVTICYHLHSFFRRQACSLSDKYKDGKLCAYQLLCRMTLERYDHPLPEDFLAHAYRLLHEGLNSPDQVNSAAMLDDLAVSRAQHWWKKGLCLWVLISSKRSKLCFLMCHPACLLNVNSDWVGGVTSTSCRRFGSAVVKSISFPNSSGICWRPWPLVTSVIFMIMWYLPTLSLVHSMFPCLCVFVGVLGHHGLHCSHLVLDFLHGAAWSNCAHRRLPCCCREDSGQRRSSGMPLYFV